MRFLSALSNVEGNRDAFGVLRGRCLGCSASCERFAPDLSEGAGWNAARQLQCAHCACAATLHCAIRDHAPAAALESDADPPCLTQPTVSVTALRRAADTLRDFARGYLPLHGVEPHEVGALLAPLVWAEATLYGLDEANELAVRDAAAPEPAALPAWTALADGLAELELMDPALRRELSAGLAYWAAERRLCRALDAGGAAPVLSVVETALQGKSFDYRVLHLVAQRWLGAAADPALMDALRLYEQMIETRDDLLDYPDDEARGAFNVVRLFCAMHGRGPAATAALTRYCEDVERRYAAKLALVNPRMRIAHTRYVQAEKGSVWLWGACMPAVSPHAPPPPQPQQSQGRAPLLFSYADVRRAVPLIQHVVDTLAPLLGLAPHAALLAHVDGLAVAALAATTWHRLDAQRRALLWRALCEAGHGTAVARALLEDGDAYYATLADPARCVRTEADVWRVLRLRCFDSLFVLEVLAREARVVAYDDDVRALALTADALLCLRLDAREFAQTAVRDATGRVTLSSLALDPRQANTVLLLHAAVRLPDVDAVVQAQVALLEAEALKVLAGVDATVRARYQELPPAKV